MINPTIYSELTHRLNQFKPRRLKRGEQLAKYTTFKIGGPADLLYEPSNAEGLAAGVIMARELGVPYFVLGLGANILIGDKGFRGLVIRNTANAFKLSPDKKVIAESGVVVGDLIMKVVEHGWSGLEHYVGIPSTVGGAIWQNLHFLSPAPERARTMYIEEIFHSAEILTARNERKTVDKKYMQFGYDTSILHTSKDVVLTATFQMKGGNSAQMHRVMQENLSWRGAKHPWLEIYPSAGSIFKKIKDVGAGRLVEEAGLKGHRHRNAQISSVHANIIVNLGSASARDVRELIDLTQRTVLEKTGHKLEPEIGFVGEF